MLIDLLGGEPALVAAGVAVYAVTVLHLVARDIKFPPARACARTRARVALGEPS